MQIDIIALSLLFFGVLLFFAIFLSSVSLQAPWQLLVALSRPPPSQPEVADRLTEAAKCKATDRQKKRALYRELSRRELSIKAFFGFLGFGVCCFLVVSDRF